MLFCSDETHPDAVVICPYDENHKIARARFQRHLVKCEKNFPEGYLEICPFNASHRCFKAEMEKHILSCPMRRFMDPSQYQNSARTNGYSASRLVSESTSTIDFVECWSDDESDLQSKKGEVNSFQNNVTIQEKIEEEDYSQPLRRPYGYSQVMLMEVNESIEVEDDMGSVMSYMGMGRGRGRGVAKPKDKHLLKKIGFGRGKGITLEDDL